MMALPIERARYEAERPERRYRQVEPERRLVARGLERDWEKALGALARRRRQTRRPPNPVLRTNCLPTPASPAVQITPEEALRPSHLPAIAWDAPRNPACRTRREVPEGTTRKPTSPPPLDVTAAQPVQFQHARMPAEAAGDGGRFGSVRTYSTT